MSSFSIRIDERVANVAEELAGLDSAGSDIGERRAVRLFPSMAEAVVFAALIGYGAQRREKLGTPRKNPISSQIFESAQLQGYVFLIAVADCDEIDILRDENLPAAVEVFEEYAFGGFLELLDYMEKSRHSLFDAVLARMTAVAAELSQSASSNTEVPVIIRRKKRLILKPSSNV